MIDKLERKIGKYAIKNLIYYVLGGYVIGYILALFDSSLGLYQYITLNPAMVMQGQVWRLFTWILTPPSTLSIWIIFMFMLYFFIGKSLEQTMGAFRYNLYIFSGWFFMTAGAMLLYLVTGAMYGSAGALSINVSTYYINLTSFLAFAVYYPDFKVYLFGLLPLKMKWLAIFDIVYLGMNVLSGIIVIIMVKTNSLYLANVMNAYGMTGYTTSAVTQQAVMEIFSILISLLNFLIFFLANKDLKRMSPAERRRRAAFRRQAEAGRRANAAYTNSNSSTRTASGAGAAAGAGQTFKKYKPDPSKGAVHKCAVCGRTNITNPELSFRYCSKCSGNHEYCEDHLFTHEHVK